MSTSAIVIEFIAHNFYSLPCPASRNSHNSSHYTITISLGEECKMIHVSLIAAKASTPFWSEQLRERKKGRTLESSWSKNPLKTFNVFRFIPKLWVDLRRVIIKLYIRIKAFLKFYQVVRWFWLKPRCNYTPNCFSLLIRLTFLIMDFPSKCAH